MSSTEKSKVGDLSASKSSGHSRIWKIALLVAVIVMAGRVALIFSRAAHGATASTAITAATVIIVIASAIIVPVQLMRARSAAQVSRAIAGNPGAFVVAAIRSPIGKDDFKWINESFRPNLFYTVVANERGLTLWEGGTNAKAVLTIASGQVSSIGTTNLRLGSVTYPAVRIVFNHGLNVAMTAAGDLAAQSTADFFVRNPNRPQRPRSLADVNVAATSLARALHG